MKTITAALLARAAEDEATLRFVGLADIPFGLHAQAAIEKLLKALINERGEKYPRIHDLNGLVHRLEMLGESLPVVGITLGDLTRYALDLRYGESELLPPPLDRKLCLESVELLRAHVSGRIQALNLAPPSPPHTL